MEPTMRLACRLKHELPDVRSRALTDLLADLDRGTLRVSDVANDADVVLELFDLLFQTQPSTTTALLLLLNDVAQVRCAAEELLRVDAIARLRQLEPSLAVPARVLAHRLLHQMLHLAPYSLANNALTQQRPATLERLDLDSEQRIRVYLDTASAARCQVPALVALFLVLVDQFPADVMLARPQLVTVLLDRLLEDTSSRAHIFDALFALGSSLSTAIHEQSNSEFCPLPQQLQGLNVVVVNVMAALFDTLACSPHTPSSVDAVVPLLTVWLPLWSASPLTHASIPAVFWQAAADAIQSALANNSQTALSLVDTTARLLLHPSFEVAETHSSHALRQTLLDVFITYSFTLMKQCSATYTLLVHVLGDEASVHLETLSSLRATLHWLNHSFPSTTSSPPPLHCLVQLIASFASSPDRITPTVLQGVCFATDMALTARDSTALHQLLSLSCAPLTSAVISFLSGLCYQSYTATTTPTMSLDLSIDELDIDREHNDDQSSLLLHRCTHLLQVDENAFLRVAVHPLTAIDTQTFSHHEQAAAQQLLWTLTDAVLAHRLNPSSIPPHVLSGICCLVEHSMASSCVRLLIQHICSLDEPLTRTLTLRILCTTLVHCTSTASFRDWCWSQLCHRLQPLTCTPPDAAPAALSIPLPKLPKNKRPPTSQRLTANAIARSFLSSSPSTVSSLTTSPASVVDPLVRVLRSARPSGSTWRSACDRLTVLFQHVDDVAVTAAHRATLHHRLHDLLVAAIPNVLATPASVHSLVSLLLSLLSVPSVDFLCAVHLLESLDFYRLVVSHPVPSTALVLTTLAVAQGDQQQQSTAALACEPLESIPQCVLEQVHSSHLSQLIPHPNMDEALACALAALEDTSFTETRRHHAALSLLRDIPLLTLEQRTRVLSSGEFLTALAASLDPNTSPMSSAMGDTLQRLVILLLSSCPNVECTLSVACVDSLLGILSDALAHIAANETDEALPNVLSNPVTLILEATERLCDHPNALSSTTLADTFARLLQRTMGEHSPVVLLRCIVRLFQSCHDHSSVSVSLAPLASVVSSLLGTSLANLTSRLTGPCLRWSALALLSVCTYDRSAVPALPPRLLVELFSQTRDLPLRCIIATLMAHSEVSLPSSTLDQLECSPSVSDAETAVRVMLSRDTLPSFGDLLEHVHLTQSPSLAAALAAHVCSVAHNSEAPSRVHMETGQYAWRLLARLVDTPSSTDLSISIRWSIAHTLHGLALLCESQPQQDDSLLDDHAHVLALASNAFVSHTTTIPVQLVRYGLLVSVKLLGTLVQRTNDRAVVDWLRISCQPSLLSSISLASTHTSHVLPSLIVLLNLLTSAALRLDTRLEFVRLAEEAEERKCYSQLVESLMASPQSHGALAHLLSVSHACKEAFVPYFASTFERCQHISTTNVHQSLVILSAFVHDSPIARAAFLQADGLDALVRLVQSPATNTFTVLRAALDVLRRLVVVSCGDDGGQDHSNIAVKAHESPSTASYGGKLPAAVPLLRALDSIAMCTKKKRKDGAVMDEEVRDEACMTFAALVVRHDWLRALQRANLVSVLTERVLACVGSGGDSAQLDRRLARPLRVLAAACTSAPGALLVLQSRPDALVSALCSDSVVPRLRESTQMVSRLLHACALHSTSAQRLVASGCIPRLTTLVMNVYQRTPRDSLDRLFRALSLLASSTAKGRAALHSVDTAQLATVLGACRTIETDETHSLTALLSHTSENHPQ